MSVQRDSLATIRRKVEVALRSAEQIGAEDEIKALTAVHHIGLATLARERNGSVCTLLSERFLNAIREARSKWPYLDL
jgi:methionine salvage enolase-phosphatase E1